MQQDSGTTICVLQNARVLPVPSAMFSSEWVFTSLEFLEKNPPEDPLKKDNKLGATKDNQGP